MQKKYTRLCAAVILGISSGVSHAGVSEQEAAKLGDLLTPLGAERAANTSGTIPEWTGGITTPPESYVLGQHHVDPFQNDKVLFTITGQNYKEYESNLSAGQIALFEHYPDTFKMPVYQTRRSGSAPQWVYDNTKRNATNARLVENGNGFTGAYGGIPFPIPANGIELIWNHIARYHGTASVRRIIEANVQRNGNRALITNIHNTLIEYYRPNGSVSDMSNILLYYKLQTKAPARLAGGITLVHDTLDQQKEPRQVWQYSPGQRRVRRAPQVAYDTPYPGSDGMRTADDTDMFSGSPDKYDWQLVGKQEVYIPYNSYRITQPDLTYDDLLTPNHINPEHARYELHRVWVVEATLKEGQRHSYKRRTIYLDEDSWQATILDQYDGRDQLWRVSIGYLKNYYELPSVMAAFSVYHDLQSGRYHVQNLDNEEPNSTLFSDSGNTDDYTPSALRQMGTR